MMESEMFPIGLHY